MTFALREFLSPITYWRPTGTDGAGGRIYADPVVVYGHYEETNMRVQADGVEIESNASACVEDDVLVEGLLLVGDHTKMEDGTTDTTPEYRRRVLSRARKIVKFMKVPSVLKDGTFDRTAYM